MINRVNLIKSYSFIFKNTSFLNFRFRIKHDDRDKIADAKNHLAQKAVDY